MCSKDRGLQGFLRKKEGKEQLLVSANSRALLRFHGRRPLLSVSPRRTTRAVMEGGRERAASTTHTMDADKFCFVTSDSSINTQKLTCVLSLWQGHENGRWGPLTRQTLCWIREDERCCGNEIDFWSFWLWKALHCCKRISWRINYADYNSTPAGKTYFKQTNNSGCKHGYAT